MNQSEDFRSFITKLYYECIRKGLDANATGVDGNNNISNRSSVNGLCTTTGRVLTPGLFVPSHWRRLNRCCYYHSIAALFCPRTFDGYLCWPRTEAGVRVSQKCPVFVTGFDNTRMAYKT